MLYLFIFLIVYIVSGIMCLLLPISDRTFTQFCLIPIANTLIALIFIVEFIFDKDIRSVIYSLIVSKLPGA